MIEMKDRLRRLEHLNRGRIRHRDLSQLTGAELRALENLPRDGTTVAAYVANLSSDASDLLAHALSRYAAAPEVMA